MIRRTNIHKPISKAPDKYTPTYHKCRHFSGSEIEVDTGSGIAGLFPGDILYLHDPNILNYSKDGYLEVIGTARTVSEKTVLCCNILSPTDGISHPMFYLFSHYMKSIHHVKIVKRNHKDITKYKQYPYSEML